MKAPRPALFRELLETRERLARERLEAAPILAAIRQRLPFIAVPPDIPQAWRTLPVVDGLCDIAAEHLERAPAVSVHTSELAVAVADVVDPTYLPVLRRLARAHAWYALGAARRAAGDREQALTALGRAREIAQQRTALPEETAWIDLTAARTLIDLGRLADASPRLRDARAVFESLGLAGPVAQCDALLQALEWPPETRRNTRIGVFENATLMSVFALEFLLLALLFGLFAAGLPAWAASLVVGLVPAVAAAVVVRRRSSLRSGAPP